MSKDTFKGPSANFLFANEHIKAKSYINADDAQGDESCDDFKRLHLEDVQRIPLDRLVKFPSNRTYNEENIELLKNDILAEGFNTVIMVAEEVKTDPTATGQMISENDSAKPRTGKKTGKFIILRGHRRFDALTRALKEDASISPDNCISAYVVEPELSWDRLMELNMTDNHRAERVSLRDQRKEIAELTRLYKKRGLKDAVDRVSRYYDRDTKQIYKSVQISEKLIKAFLDEYDHGFINTETALALCRLSEKKQEEALILYKKNKGITDDDIKELTDVDGTMLLEKKLKELESAEAQKSELQNELIMFRNGNEKELSDAEVQSLKRQRDSISKKIKRLRTCIEELENKPIEVDDKSLQPKPEMSVATRVARIGSSVRKEIKCISDTNEAVSEDDIKAIDNIINELIELKSSLNVI